MSKNLVIFGPAHGGKSSLIGFLRAAEMGREFNKWREQQQRLSNEFRDADKYRLLIDTHEEERRRQAKEGHGTSWYMHTALTHVGQHEVLLIDTPGREHERTKREMLRGLFYGDIGILLLDINWFRDQERLFDDFSQLETWLSFGYRREAVIVVLAKMDSIAFSEERYTHAKTISDTLIQGFLKEAGLENTPAVVIPTGIDFTNEIGHNILQPSTSMPWYNGDVLIQAVEHFCATGSSQPRDKDVPLLVCIRRTYNLPNAKPMGIIVEGKIMAGSLCEHDRIKVVPTLFEKSEWNAMTGVAAELRLLGTDQAVSQCVAGDMITVNCSDLRVAGRVVKGDQVSIVPSCILIKDDESCTVGNILLFEASAGDLQKLVLLQEVSLLWFGRNIAAQVVQLDCSLGHVGLELRDMRAGIPMDARHGMRHRDFLVRVERAPTRGEDGQKPIYMPVRLRNIGIPVRVIYEPHEQLEQRDLNELFSTVSYRLRDTVIEFEVDGSCITVLWQIKEAEKICSYDPMARRGRVSIELASVTPL